MTPDTKIIMQPEKNSTLCAIHLVLKPAKDPRPEFDPCIDPDPESIPAPETPEKAAGLLAAEGIIVEHVGGHFLTAVATISRWEEIFQTVVVEKDRQKSFETKPTIPTQWSDVISTVFFPPPFEYCE